MDLKENRAIVLGVYINSQYSNKEIAENSLKELIELSETTGLEVVGESIQFRKKFNPTYAAGSGKLLEIAKTAKNLEADTIVLDLNLSGSQMRNISELTDLKVLDRTLIILDIFAMRAQTSEGRLQVEIAQLNDRATRLVGAGKALSRLGGGIGTRGPGETKLETDRRHIQRRIKYLENKLEDVQKQRSLTRASRKNREVYKVAIVGYTNAGKSTLLNALADSDVLTMDQVFATLDPTARQLKGSDIPILLIDTVGFIRNLPHELVDAFASTLEEVTYADMIVEVTDLSDPEYLMQIDVVERQLEALKADAKPRIHVFNKMELVDPSVIETLQATNRHGVKQIFTSALNGIGIEELRQAILELPEQAMLPYHLLIPYEHTNIVSELQEYAIVEEIEYLDEGMNVVFKIRQADLGIISPLLNNNKK